MRAGALDKRVTIQLNTPTQDANGETVDSLATFAEAWAGIKDLNGREFLAASATQNSVTTKILIRYLAGVLPSMRVVHGTDIYNIEAPLKHGKDGLMLMCSRVI